MEKVSRRRFFVDAMALGGVLLGAAVTPRPFWSHFLEGQEEPEVAGADPPQKDRPKVTLAYPSDSDRHKVVTQAYPSDSDQPKVTLAYPSDSDIHGKPVTRCYPSDWDVHATPRPRPQPEDKPQSLLLPLWMRLS